MSSPVTSSIHPETTVEVVRLGVSDIPRSRKFYEDVLGFKTLQIGARTALLGTPDGTPLVEIVEIPEAVSASRRSTGLFHMAILLPSRAALGRTLTHLAEAGWSLSGAGDHLVSEALYLNDIDGNGIELYTDRPKESWKFKDGRVQMDTLHVDIDSLIEEGKKDGSSWTGLPNGTHMGHVHLKVADLDASLHFYHDILGFDVMTSMPQALFLAAGGYHHHLGLNTWMSNGSPPPPPNAIGLQFFTIQYPIESARQVALDRLTAEDIAFTPSDGGYLVRDPSHNGVLLTVRS